MRCHLCTERITRDQERCPGGHPTKPEPSQIFSIYNNSLLSEAKKRIYPFQCLATDSIAKQLAFKEFMRGCIKCLFKIQYECVNLSSIVQDFSPIIYYCSQLSFTTMSFPECMLPIWQEFIFIKMSHDIWTYYVRGSSLALVICETSQVQLAGGQVFFLGISRPPPPTHTLRLTWLKVSEIILTCHKAQIKSQSILPLQRLKQ